MMSREIFQKNVKMVTKKYFMKFMEIGNACRVQLMFIQFIFIISAVVKIKFNLCQLFSLLYFSAAAVKIQTK